MMDQKMIPIMPQALEQRPRISKHMKEASPERIGRSVSNIPTRRAFPAVRLSRDEEGHI